MYSIIIIILFTVGNTQNVDSTSFHKNDSVSSLTTYYKEIVNTGSTPDSLDRIISLLTTVISLLTLLLIFKTLREMQKQRKNSYRAEIGFVSDYYYYEIDEKFNIKQGNVESYYSSAKTGSFLELYVNIYNLGFGAAKNVKINWDFNFEKIKKIFNQTKFENMKVEFEETDSVIIVITNNIRKVFFKPIEIRLKYLIPASAQKKSMKIPVPNSYMYLYTIISKYFTSEENEFPPLTLECEYEDIDGDKSKIKFYVKPIDYYGSYSSNEKCIINYFFEIKEL